MIAIPSLLKNRVPLVSLYAGKYAKCENMS